MGIASNATPSNADITLLFTFIAIASCCLNTHKKCRRFPAVILSTFDAFGALDVVSDEFVYRKEGDRLTQSVDSA
jgi:hypothetical protein